MAGTLRDAFINNLRDIYDAERQLSDALPRLAKAATSADLRMAFELHFRETLVHIARLDEVFDTLDETPRRQHCRGIAGIIEESAICMTKNFDDYVMDASLIATSQRAEHYEMAVYSSLLAWALAIGYQDAAELLKKTLEEKAAADRKLTSLAESGINEDAADRDHEGGAGEPSGVGAMALRTNKPVRITERTRN